MKLLMKFITREEEKKNAKKKKKTVKHNEEGWYDNHLLWFNTKLANIGLWCVIIHHRWFQIMIFSFCINSEDQ